MEQREQTLRPTRSAGGIALRAAGAFVLLVGLYYAQTHSFLLFHTVVEIFAVSVAAALFMLAWNSRYFADQHFLLWIGIGYLFVGMLDLLHTLAYKDMAVLGDLGTDPATQLWVAARFMQALILLTAPLFFERKLRPHRTLAGFGAVTALVVLSIFAWDIFPTAYSDAQNTLTPFKIISEYVICGMLLAAAAWFLVRRGEVGRTTLALLVGSILATLVAEISFTLYSDPFGSANLLGHFLKLVAFYLIYKALVEASLRRPYEVLFRDLKQREEQLERSRQDLEALNETLEERVEERAEQARALAAQLAHAESRERERLAGILHDDLQQLLAAARMRLKMASASPDSQEKLLGAADEHVSEAIELCRCLAVEVSPAVVREKGLESALEWLGEHMRHRHELSVEVRTNGDIDLGNPDVEALIFKVVRELLFNAVKHAGVRDARVHAEVNCDGELCVLVSDDGCGFDPDEVNSAAGEGFGLGSVRNRVAMLGGYCEIDSAPGEGTDVRLVVPRQAS